MDKYENYSRELMKNKRSRQNTAEKEKLYVVEFKHTIQVTTFATSQRHAIEKARVGDDSGKETLIDTFAWKAWRNGE